MVTWLRSFLMTFGFLASPTPKRRRHRQRVTGESAYKRQRRTMDPLQSLTGYQILKIISDRGQATVREIDAALDVTTTRFWVPILRDRELIVAHRGEKARRGAAPYVYTLTPLGRSAIDNRREPIHAEG